MSQITQSLYKAWASRRHLFSRFLACRKKPKNLTRRPRAKLLHKAGFIVFAS
jgi:hypothetical protein